MAEIGHDFIVWAQDKKAVLSWQLEHNLAKLLGPRPSAGRKWRNDTAGVLVRIKNFLPEKVISYAGLVAFSLVHTNNNQVK